MRMKIGYFGLLMCFISLFVTIGVQAQTNTAVGVYEAKDKISGMTRLGYLEINLDESTVPDFSQQFEKDKNYRFMLLPENFQKKPSTYFKGQKAAGFVKFQSKMLFINSEICKLTEPNKGDNCWTLNWEDDLGKKGKCILYMPTDSTLLFIGLGSFDKSIGPDSLLFVLSKQATANKPYLIRKVRPQKAETPPATDKPSSSTSFPNIPKDLADWRPTAPKVLKLPPANSGVIKGSWMGRNSDESTVLIKLNSTAKTIYYHDIAYYGTIIMDGPTFIEEGVLAIVKLKENQFGLYTRSLNSGAQPLHYSIVVAYYKDLMFYPTADTPGLTQMGRPSPVSTMIYCKAICEQAIGLFTTGKEVANFPMNLYRKSRYKSATGDFESCYGFIFTSFNSGSRIDADKIISSNPIDEKTFNIKYECGRTGNVYIATLVYDATLKSLKVTQVKMLKQESDFPDSDDCYLPDSAIKYVGPLKE